jgi:hypothetical protein
LITNNPKGDNMASEEDSSTRTIASVAAVIGLLALAWTAADSTQQGLLAQYVGTTKQISGQNDAAMQKSIEALAARIGALEASAAAPAAAPAEAPAAEEAPPAE